MLFAEAENLLGDNIEFSIDYAKAVGMAGATLQDDPLLNDVYKHLQRIYEKALQKTLNLENWAIILLRVGRCSEA